MLPLQTVEHFVSNRDGWLLQLRQIVAPDRLDPARPPIVIVPGYGMNSFIFGFHPRGTSMERSFAEDGFEVWSINLRNQGGSRPERRNAPPPSLQAYAERDLAAAIDAILQRTRTAADRVHAIGCSLGGSITYAHLALRPDHHIATVTAIGSPLRWLDLHPALRLAFSSPDLVSLVRFRGTQTMARTAFPLLARVPALLSVYMNPDNVDLSASRELTRTVDDPHPRVNRDIAAWMKNTDLVLDRKDVTRALGHVDLPLLTVLGNRDGIVPETTATSALDAWGGTDRTRLVVGDDRSWYAHADLFIGHEAPERVFRPIADWLRARS